MCVMVFSCDGLRCWGEAKAHADALWAQGVHVEVEPNMRMILFGPHGGGLHDAPDGSPAYQEFYDSGWPRVVGYYQDSEWCDPADGTPACQEFYPDGQWKAIGYYGNGERCVQSFYPDGQLETIEHYSNGWLHDPADGSPARQWFYPNGSRQAVEHYSNGELFDPADGAPTPRSSSRTWKSRFRKRV